MNFDDLEHCMSEEIMMENEEPALIAAEVSKLLNGLNQRDVFVVHRLAKDIGAAIGYELAFRDEDMAEVVKNQTAMLEPMITFLERHGAGVPRGSGSK